jgi:hypothetical protein
LPRRLLSFSMQVVTEEGGLDILPELEGGFVAAERDGANAVSDRSGPSSVKPWPGDHEVGVLRVVLLSMTEYLPGTPGVFLVPKAGYIQVGHSGTVELVDPGFLFPELVVVRVAHHVVPVGQRSVEIFFIEIGERPHFQVPVVGVVGVEIEVGVFIFVRLLHHCVFKGIALA